MQNMTAVVPRFLQIPNPFTSTLNAPSTFRTPHKSFTPRALDDDSKPATKEEEELQPPTATTVSDQSFDTRLAQVRLKYRSGTGKKAEQRKSKKSGGVSSKKKGGGGAVMLPPVPLKESITAAGLKVDFGFCPYSERLNARLAALGLAALVLVELGSGKGILSYHAPPILFIQIYTVAAASAVFIKYEKERISVWPKKAPSSSAVVGD